MIKQKLLYVLFLLFFLIFLTNSQIQKTPKIFCEEPVYDFGTISHNNTIKHTFVIQNTGDDVLKILNIRVACGCTVAKIKKKSIKPGKTTDLRIDLDLRGTEGKQSKEITIESNDPDNKYYRLYIRGFTTNKNSQVF